MKIDYQNTFSNYFTPNPTETIVVINIALNNEFKNIDCLIITNDHSGNGATHLLNATLQSIVKMRKQVICYSAFELLAEINKRPESTLDELLQYEYIGIDGFHDITNSRFSTYLYQ